jgi:hypothetical protein
MSVFLLVDNLVHIVPALGHGKYVRKRTQKAINIGGGAVRRRNGNQLIVTSRVIHNYKVVSQFTWLPVSPTMVLTVHHLDNSRSQRILWLLVCLTPSNIALCSAVPQHHS